MEQNGLPNKPTTVLSHLFGSRTVNVGDIIYIKSKINGYAKTRVRKIVQLNESYFLVLEVLESHIPYIIKGDLITRSDGYIEGYGVDWVFDHLEDPNYSSYYKHQL